MQVQMQSGFGRGRGRGLRPDVDVLRRPQLPIGTYSSGPAQTDGDNVPPYSKQAIEIIDRIQQREADNAMVISQFKSLLEGLSEEQARQVMNDCHKKCLGHGGDFPQKFAFVYSQFRKQLFHSPQSAPVNLQNLFLPHLEQDFKERVSLHTRSEELLVNAAILLCETLFLTRLDDGSFYKFLLVPARTYVEIMLSSSSLKTIKVCCRQMLQLAVLFKSNSPDDYTALLNQLRLEVVKDTQREPGAKCHLLMMLESLISEGGRLGEDGKKFYEGQGVDKSLLQLSCQVVHEMKNLSIRPVQENRPSASMRAAPQKMEGKRMASDSAVDDSWD